MTQGRRVAILPFPTDKPVTPYVKAARCLAWYVAWPLAAPMARPELARPWYTGPPRKALTRSYNSTNGHSRPCPTVAPFVQAANAL